jgi:hypothetical protein
LYSFVLGTLITVVGTVQSDQDFDNSPLSYVLDGEDDLTFPFNASSPNIYSSPELLLGSHTLAIRLLNENTTLSVSGGSITTSQPTSANHHRTIAIIAGTLGGFVVLVVIILALFLFNRRHRQYSNSSRRFPTWCSSLTYIFCMCSGVRPRPPSGESAVNEGGVHVPQIQQPRNLLHAIDRLRERPPSREGPASTTA